MAEQDDATPVGLYPTNKSRYDLEIHDNTVNYGSIISDHYDIDKPGKYIVFNHLNYHLKNKKNLSPREGTEHDVNNITREFDDLGFEGKVHDNLTADDIEEKLCEVFTSDFSGYNSLFVFILTHGGDNNRLYAYDRDYDFEALANKLVEYQSPSLVGLPKVFVIQACRGKVQDSGKVGVGSSGMSEDKKFFYCLPTHSDLLFAYAAAPGCISFRRLDTGTWFINTLTEVVKEKKNKCDFETILKITRRKVAFEKRTQKDQAKQTPLVVTTLTRTLYLTQNALQNYSKLM